ncbi:MAG: PBP1A family penicillin-binding protein [Deltaproteobacteria bacterium]|nr:PBP1A family penicillin-binding protein [Deltaproteobacteria bacterium]
MAANPPSRGPSRRLKITLVVLASLFVLGVFTAVGTVVGVFWYYGRDLAEIDEQKLENYRPPQITRILARDGQLIGEMFTERRTFIEYEDIPSHVENAFLAAEDADFYSHEGMDYMGMVRALVANVRAGKIRQGASTITQQVVKTFILSPERSFERKVQELILARRLEQALSKTQILELYLNEIYLGHGRYGIEEASRYYFGKSVREIDVGQAALLATLPKAPGRDSPYKSPERAKTRQVYVLGQMVEHGFLAQADAQRHIDATLSQLVLDKPREAAAAEAGAEEFVDAAKRQLREHYGEDDVAHLGATVHTTVDLDAQRKVREGLRQALLDLDERQHHGRDLSPASQRARNKAAKYKGPLQPGKRVPMIIGPGPAGASLPDDAVTGHVGAQPVFIRVPAESRFREPDKSLAEQFPADAIIKVFVTRLEGEQVPSGWVEAELRGPQAATVVADTETGEVLAMIGGYEPGLAQLNRAMQSKRQPGSSFKPFIYGAAIASRELTAASLISDSPEIYDKWKPTNYERDVYRGDIRMRYALTKSVNTVAIKLLDQTGFDAVHAFAHAAGVESELPRHLSLALGTTEVSPFEMMRAYMTLARGGTRIEPRIITAVEIGGVEDWVPASEPQRTLDQDVVFILTSMMTSVVRAGTGAKAKQLGRPVAGKTGTSANAQDAWFAGFTPNRVAVAWVGFDTPLPLGRGETGGRSAIPVWLSAMEATKTARAANFVPPPTVSVRRIDEASGLLAPTAVTLDPETGEPIPTGKTLDEYFLTGTEPVDEATPAALPPGDVLLDLYGDEADPDADAAVDEGIEDPEGDDDSADDPSEDTLAKLPSLDDVP